MEKLRERYIPEGQISGFRHVHGRSEIHTLKTLQTWNPALEWNMEALQRDGYSSKSSSLGRAAASYFENALSKRSDA